MGYRIARVSGTQLDVLVELFNDAYSGYYIDVQVNPDRLRSLIQREDIRVDNSFIAYEGERPVGVVFLGIRDRRGYICGMGVRQDRQGRGIGELLMRRALDEAGRLGLDSVQLEVVEANFRAIALYSKLGFVPIRGLGLWERNRPAPWEEAACPADGADAGAPAVRVGAARLACILPLVDAFNEVRPCWQNEPRSLVKLSDRFMAYTARRSGAAVAYIVFADSPGGVYIADFAASARLESAERQSLCAALLSMVDRSVPRAIARAFNIPLGGYQGAALRAKGFDLTLMQQEMVVCLRWR